MTADPFAEVIDDVSSMLQGLEALTRGELPCTGDRMAHESLVGTCPDCGAVV